MDFIDCWYENMAIDHERTRWDQFFVAYFDADCECEGEFTSMCPAHGVAIYRVGP